MWTILIKKNADKALKKSPIQVRRKFKVWRSIVEMHGAEKLTEFPGFNDEALSGQWAGFRSSRLSGQYRVIYQVVADEIEIHIFKVTAHDYRRT